MKSEFGDDMDCTPENLQKLAMFVVNQVQEHRLLHFDSTAVARLAEYSSRIVEDHYKLTTRFATIADLITEAAYWARRAGHASVSSEDVVHAVHERRQTLSTSVR